MPRLCYDLVVIGSGPAGQKAALLAAKLGRRVALVDRAGSVGGVCIHTGTVPSKAMREAVLHLTGLRERSVYGDSYAVKQAITMDDLLYRCRHVVRTEVEVIRSQMARNGVTMLFGRGQLRRPRDDPRPAGRRDDRGEGQPRAGRDRDRPGPPGQRPVRPRAS
jgi:NAD(P) transhydrogenase